MRDGITLKAILSFCMIGVILNSCTNDNNLWLGIGGNDSKVEVRLGTGYKLKNTVELKKSKKDAIKPPGYYDERE